MPFRGAKPSLIHEVHRCPKVMQIGRLSPEVDIFSQARGQEVNFPTATTTWPFGQSYC